MIGPISQCHTCRHFRSPFSDEKFGGDPYCPAFPDVIPDEILQNRADHRQPYAGDHGIRWEQDGPDAFPEWAMNVQDGSE